MTAMTLTLLSRAFIAGRGLLCSELWFACLIVGTDSEIHVKYMLDILSCYLSK